MEILSNVQIQRDGARLNAFLVFDFLDVDNFKFAGLSADSKELLIGLRTEDGWLVTARTPENSITWGTRSPQPPILLPSFARTPRFHGLPCRLAIL